MDKYFNNKKKVIKLTGNILVVGAIIFLVKKYLDLDINIGNYVNREVVFCLAMVTVLLSVLISLQFIPWVVIVKGTTESSVPMAAFYNVFQRSNIMRYIPGNIFQYVGRGEIISEDKGLNVVNVVTSVVIESAALLLASLLVGLCCVRDYMFSLISEHKFLFLIGTVCIMIAALIAFLFRPRLIGWMRLKGIVFTRRFFACFLIAVGFFFATLIVQALFQAFIIRSISGTINTEMLLLVGGAYSVSWLAGYLTPGASGGIGVREALFCVMLEKYISTDIILVSVILFRGVNIIADFLAYAVSVVYGYMFRASKRCRNAEEIQDRGDYIDD